ncbi:MAG: hypothetical protein E6I68_03980 [Chloroflexi bacterium]|nr:MAG: hypothetical protein E6I68_03980 [Chloroflexota bacterium]
MLRSIMIAAAAAGLLAVGALTAVAATSHGKPVSDLARSTTLSGEAKGDAVNALASTKSDAATNHADATEEASEDNDTHGDAVSAVAKSDATAAHENGKNKVNHGGAVSAVARNHD